MLLNVFSTSCIYLFKLCSISIILLLKNNLTNICRKISNNEFMNGLAILQYEKLWKVQKMGKRWMYFSSLTEIMRNRWLY